MGGKRMMGGKLSQVSTQEAQGLGVSGKWAGREEAAHRGRSWYICPALVPSSGHLLNTCQQIRLALAVGPWQALLIVNLHSSKPSRCHLLQKLILSWVPFWQEGRVCQGDDHHFTK